MFRGGGCIIWSHFWLVFGILHYLMKCLLKVRVYAVQFSEENNCIVATEKLSRINSFLFFTGGHNCILPVKSFILLFLTCSRKTKMLKIKCCVIIISHIINFVSLHLLIPAWLAKFPKLVI